MTKKDYISVVSEKASVSKKDVAAVINAIGDVIVEYLGNDEIPIVDGIRLTTSVRQARNVRSPQTGELMTVPEKIVPKVKIGKGIKDLLA